MRNIRHWDNWRLDDAGHNGIYLLNRTDDPAWFRPIVSMDSEKAAMVEAERIIAEADLSKPIDWSKQPHSKEDCFKMALQVREELLKNGEAPPPLRELVSTVCRIEWMV